MAAKANASPGLKRAGVILVADQYADYISKMKAISRAHQDAFGGVSVKNVKAYQEETKRAASATEAAAKKSQAAARDTRGAFERMGDALQQAMSGDLTGGITNLIQSFNGLKAGIIGVATVLGAMKLVQFANQAIEVAMRNETMGIVLQQVGKNAGYSKEQVAYATDSVKKMGITTSAATQSLTSMAQAGIEWTSAAKLARTAQDAAVIGNINSSQAFERMIYGIKSGQVEVLRTIGLNVNFEQSYRKMAQQLGKNATTLTETEKTQARANAVIEEGTKIAGTYEAAMTSAGKMQNSMARYVEETQANIGSMLLPLKAAAVEMEYGFWKGAQQATLGLKSWGVAIDAVITGLKNLGGASKDAKDSVTIWQRVGEGLYKAGQTFTQIALLAIASFDGILAAWKQLVDNITGGPEIEKMMYIMRGAFNPPQTNEEIAKWLAGLVKIEERAKAKGTDVGQAFVDAYTASMERNLSAIEEKYPDWLSEYGEGVAKVDLTPQISAVDAYVAKLQEAIKAQQQQLAILQQVEQIDKTFRNAQLNAQKNYNKTLEQADKDLAKSQENLVRKTADSLAKLDKDSVKKEQQLRQEAAKQQVDTQKQLQKDLEQARRRFELSQLQSLRQFKQQEKWLMAEGDVLALMKAREQFDLQQQEAKENFGLQNQEQKDNAQQQAQQQQEQLQERLKELQTDIQDRRQEVVDSYSTELDDLVKANEEKKAAAKAALDEQLQAAREARDQQLQELGSNLKAQNDLTSAGMQQIANTIAQVFGEQGAADAIMQGWSLRSQTSIQQAMEAIQNQIKATEEIIAKTQSGQLPVPEQTGAETETARRPGVRQTRGVPIGMRQGGVGVVTGPALFEVEPGVREAYAFVPMGRGAGSSRIDVNVGGGIDVKGAQGASAGVVDAAVQIVFNELATAVKRLKKV